MGRLLTPQCSSDNCDNEDAAGKALGAPGKTRSFQQSWNHHSVLMLPWESPWPCCCGEQEHQAGLNFKLKLLGLWKNCTSWWWPSFYILIKSGTGCQKYPVPATSPALPDVCWALRSWEFLILQELSWRCCSGLCRALSSLCSTNFVLFWYFQAAWARPAALCPWSQLSRDPVPLLQGLESFIHKSCLPWAEICLGAHCSR